jgi:hypothetical protein
MRNGITFSLSEADRERLIGIVAAPLSPQKHVWRARIVLLSSDGFGTSAIMAATGKSKTCVWRWQGIHPVRRALPVQATSALKRALMSVLWSGYGSGDGIFGAGASSSVD